MESRGAPHCLHPWPALPRARSPCLCEISPFQVPSTPLGSRLCDGTRSHLELPCPSVCENTTSQRRHGRGGAANARLVHPSVYPSPGTSPMAAGNTSIALMRYLFLTTNRAACRSSYHGVGQRNTMQSGTTARSALLVGSLYFYSYAFSCQDASSRNSNRASSQRRMALFQCSMLQGILCILPWNSCILVWLVIGMSESSCHRRSLYSVVLLLQICTV